MALLPARVARTGVYPGANPHLSSELGQLDPWLWAPAAYDGPSAPHTAPRRPAPSVVPRTLSAREAVSFFTDFYHRVHVTPVAIDLGNLVSEQVRHVDVWNAFLTPVAVLDTPMEGGEGIEVTPPGALPLTLRPLQEARWTLGISTDGPAIVDATWTFQFSGLAPVTVRIVGDRIVPWSFAPDWSEGVTERLSWLTEVLASPSRAEQRRSLRLSPSRQFEVRTLLQHEERAHFDLAVYSWGGRTWAMPVWPDVEWLQEPVNPGAQLILCDPAGRDFVAGGLALLRAGDATRSRAYEVVEVAEVAANGLVLRRPAVQAWPRGSRLYPLRLAELVAPPRVRRLTDTTAEARCLFDVVEPSDWSAVMPPTLYRGHPVLEQVPDESEDLTIEWDRPQLVLENPTGWPRRTATAATPATLQQHRWLLGGLGERASYRSLLYALAGRWKSLWVPTFAADLVLRETVGPTTAVLVVDAVDYARFGVGRTGRRDIRIQLRDGTAHHRRITAATLVDDAIEQLAIDAPLGVEVQPHQVQRISFMALCRSDVDSVELVHLTDAEGVARSSLIFRSIRDDV